MTLPLCGSTGSGGRYDIKITHVGPAELLFFVNSDEPPSLRSDLDRVGRPPVRAVRQRRLRLRQLLAVSPSRVGLLPPRAGWAGPAGSSALKDLRIQRWKQSTASAEERRRRQSRGLRV